MRLFVYFILVFVVYFLYNLYFFNWVFVKSLIIIFLVLILLGDVSFCFWTFTLRRWWKYKWFWFGNFHILLFDLVWTSWLILCLLFWWIVTFITFRNLINFLFSMFYWFYWFFWFCLFFWFLLFYCFCWFLLF